MNTQTFDIVNEIELSQIELITKDSNIIKIYYEDVVVDDGYKAHKVYTGNVGMNGKLGISRVLKSLRYYRKERIERQESITITINQLKAIGKEMKLRGYVEGADYKTQNILEKDGCWELYRLDNDDSKWQKDRDIYLDVNGIYERNAAMYE